MVKGQKKVKLMQPKGPRWGQGFTFSLLLMVGQGVGLPPQGNLPATAQSPAAIPSVVADRSIVDDIRTTGVLNVAIRSDSPLFGYIDTNRQWTGYCFDLVAAVETSLEAMAGIPAAD